MVGRDGVDVRGAVVARDEREEARGREFAFVVTLRAPGHGRSRPRGRSYALQATSARERDAWMRLIADAARLGDGNAEPAAAPLATPPRPVLARPASTPALGRPSVMDRVKTA